MTANSNKQFAVVTGASSGIGLELAKQFAKGGYNLLIVAEDAGIHTAAKEIEKLGAMVQAVQIDLASHENIDKFYQTIKSTGSDIDAIAINAGIGLGGAFKDQALQKIMKLIDLNVMSSVHLAHHVVKDMVARNKGKILFTASIASTTPGPYEAVYAASKAFLLSFSDALRVELKDTNVTVTALMPGATETNFFHRAGLDDTKVGAGKKDDATEVAEIGFKALMDGDQHALGPSVKTKLMGYGNEILPEAIKANMHADMSKPGSAAK